MSRLLVAVSLTFASLAAYGGPLFSTLLERQPTASAIVPVPYQTAHRNIAAGLRICAPYDPIVTGTIYSEESFGDLFVYQRSSDNPLLSYIEVRAISATSSRVEAWHVKPTFGEGLVHFAKSAPALAATGAKSDCKELGF